MMASKPTVTTTPIPGLLKFDLKLIEDSRGWFKENYNQEDMSVLGIKDFRIVQSNFSLNKEVGVTRGLHAEPWDKFVSLANGSVFGVWVDLRLGETYGKVYSDTLSPNIAMYIPKGIANGYQTLENNTVYTYLVNKVWVASDIYISLDLFDPDLAIKWPVKKAEAIVSIKDSNRPKLSELKNLGF
jgi:dTDP-4-dehydrorhamnose 3,5-epimerase